MRTLLSRFHNFIYGSFLKYFRTRQVLQVFEASHVSELRDTPITQWPMLKQKHRQEIAAVKAGQLDIVDRKSWSWPFLPASINRLSVPVQKSSPYNLKRFGRTPVPRRAMNIIKSAVISQSWEVRAKDDVLVDDKDEQKERIRIASRIFEHPNNQDSFQTFIEQGLEDFLSYGGFCCEIGVTVDPMRPVKLWAVNVESIRKFLAWSESTPDMPRYAQMTGLKGERGAICFYDDEMFYMMDNPSTDNPFGLGKLEVGFTMINYLLGIHDMAGKAGADTVHKTWLWWSQPQSDSAYQIIRRHIQNDLEGQAKVSIIGGMQKPDVLEINPVLEQDLLLNWQEMLIRMIANAFDMSAMALGIEHDVNRAVGTVLADRDFRTAVVPTAKRLQEVFTRKILHSKLGWMDLEFVFLNLDDPDRETMGDMMSRMYSANAVTPNEYRAAMGKERLDSPFADLTQFECMLINMEAMAKVQNQSADQAANRQLQVQQKSTQMQQDMQRQQEMEQYGGYQDQGDQGGGGQGGGQPQQTQQPSGEEAPLKMTPGNVAKGGQPPSPKPMSLPKFPIAGSRWTASAIAQMPVNSLVDRMLSGQLPKSPSKLLAQMQAQEPGILEQMTDEIREFFDEAIEQEEQETQKRKTPKQQIKKWETLAKQRYGKNAKRTNDMSQWLYEKGRFAGKPGGPSRTNQPGLPPQGGKAGNINPITRW